MNHRAELIQAWLEEEGERLDSRDLLPAQPGDTELRGVIQLCICFYGGAFVAVLCCLWLASTSPQVQQVRTIERLRARLFSDSGRGLGLWNLDPEENADHPGPAVGRE